MLPSNRGEPRITPERSESFAKRGVFLAGNPEWDRSGKSFVVSAMGMASEVRLPIRSERISAPTSGGYGKKVARGSVARVDGRRRRLNDYRSMQYRAGTGRFVRRHMRGSGPTSHSAANLAPIKGVFGGAAPTRFARTREQCRAQRPPVSFPEERFPLSILPSLLATAC